MGRAAAALFFVVVLFACAPDPAGRLFQTSVTAPDGSYPLVIVLGDRTGFVLGVQPIEWPAISFATTGDRYELRLDPRPRLGPCTATLLRCGIRIDVIEQVPADHVDLVVAR